LGQINPEVAVGRDTSVLREMLDAAAARIGRGEPRDDPETEVRLRRTIGSCYGHIGQFKLAGTMTTSALDLARRMLAPDNPELINAVFDMGWVTSDCLGRPDAALALFQEALAGLRRIFPGDEPHVAQTMHNIGNCLLAMGRPDEA